MQEKETNLCSGSQASYEQQMFRKPKFNEIKYGEKKSMANKWSINYTEGKTKRCYLSWRANFSENCFLTSPPLLAGHGHCSSYDEIRSHVHTSVLSQIS